MMVSEASASDSRAVVLPSLTLQYMTQHQLEELIPKLITKVTGQKPPLFGSVQDKPPWWPAALEWINPGELADLYQDPCDKLREIVRCCYCHMDQDNLLISSDISADLPTSPDMGDRDMCSLDQDSDQSSTSQTRQGDNSGVTSLDEPVVIDLSDSEDSEKTSPKKGRDLHHLKKSTKNPGHATCAKDLSENSPLDGKVTSSPSVTNSFNFKPYKKIGHEDAKVVNESDKDTICIEDSQEIGDASDDANQTDKSLVQSLSTVKLEKDNKKVQKLEPEVDAICIDSSQEEDDALKKSQPDSNKHKEAKIRKHTEHETPARKPVETVECDKNSYKQKVNDVTTPVSSKKTVDMKDEKKTRDVECGFKSIDFIISIEDEESAEDPNSKSNSASDSSSQLFPSDIANTSSKVQVKKGDKSTGVIPVTSNTDSAGSSTQKDDQSFGVSDEMLAQIDQEIAKSLQSAFQNMDNLGLGSLGLNFKGKGKRGPKPKNWLFDPLTKVEDSDTKSKVTKPNILRRKGKDGKRLIDVLDDNKSMSDSEISISNHPKRRRTSHDLNDPDWGTISFKKQLTSVSKSVNDAIDKLEKSARKDAVAKTVDTKQPSLRDTKRQSDKPAVKDEKLEDDVVWICFVCAKSFPGQSQLMAHQDVCEEDSEPPSSDFTPLTPYGPTSSTGQQERNPFLTEILVKSGQRGITPAQNSDKQNPPIPRSPVQPVPTLLRKVGSSLKSLPLGLPSVSRMARRRQKKFPDVYIPPSRDVYFESLGLLQTPKVEAISKSPRKSVTEDDCQIIDLTVDDSMQAVPMTPRTRSLMSQLSRDDSSGRRRQLSFSHGFNQPDVSSLANRKDCKGDSNESDCSSENEYIASVSNKVNKVPPKSAILGIPLTSPLGQRLKKHWNFDNKISIVTDSEQYCKTTREFIEKEQRSKNKNPFVEKLRHRPPPQVTFKFSKKYINKWFHSYKYNKADKYEFQKRLRTGLDRESRLRLKRMKPCKVIMQRISKKDIKYWTTPRPRYIPPKPQPPKYNRYNRVYNCQAQRPTIITNQHYRSPSLLGHQIGLQRTPQFLLQSIRPHVGSYGLPTPQLLVRTVPVNGQGLRLQVMPTNSNPMSIEKVFQSTPPMQTHSQKRKQTFTGLKEDDMVICLSSEEEEEVKKPAPCAMCRKSRESCSIHGRKKIGPASFMKTQQIRRERALSLSQESPVTREQPEVKWKTEKLPMHPVNGGPTDGVYGHSFQKVDPIWAGASASSSTPGQMSGFTDIRIVNGKQSVISQTPTRTTSYDGVEKDEKEQADVSSIPDSDYMDFEVICIDSDEES